MYEVPFEQDDPAARRRDLGLQRQGHGLRELRQVQPGGELAAARRVLGPQPRDHDPTRYFDANGVLFATEPVASSSGKLFVEDMTPRADRRVPGRHGAPVQRRAGRRALYGRYREGSHFWEDTNNDARVALQPAGRAFRASSTSRTSPQRRAQIGSGSSYVIAELDGAYTKY